MSLDLLNNTVLDYAQMDDGKYEFIFLNPNDPNYSPPTETRVDEDNDE
jgi:iron-sulfur cluster assembly protein